MCQWNICENHKVAWKMTSWMQKMRNFDFLPSRVEIWKNGHGGTRHGPIVDHFSQTTACPKVSFWECVSFIENLLSTVLRLEKRSIIYAMGYLDRSFFSDFQKQFLNGNPPKIRSRLRTFNVLWNHWYVHMCRLLFRRHYTLKEMSKLH